MTIVPGIGSSHPVPALMDSGPAVSSQQTYYAPVSHTRPSPHNQHT